jgi:hypothetical protein
MFCQRLRDDNAETYLAEFRSVRYCGSAMGKQRRRGQRQNRTEDFRQSGNAEVPIVPVQRALDVHSLYGLARVRKPVRASLA